MQRLLLVESSREITNLIYGASVHFIEQIIITNNIKFNYRGSNSIFPLKSDIFNKAENKLLLLIVFLNIFIIIPRIYDGIPSGIDTSSHLSKILFIYKSFSTLDRIPYWNPDWYCGTPFLLFYPPLSYFLVFFLSLGIQDPIISYKIIDSFFYIVAPFSIYYLAREFNYNKMTSALAALIFSLSPIIIGNYLFYDRFPNILSLPLVCILVALLHRILNRKFDIKSLAFSSLLFAGIILTHHLSALYVVLIIFILILTISWIEGEIIKKFIIVSIVFLFSFLLTSFWTVPFILNAPEQLAGNPFYNRTIDFPYIRLSYFLDNLLTREIGIAHFILAFSSLTLPFNIFPKFNRKIGKRLATLIFIFTSLIGMGIFEWGEKIGNIVLKIAGQSMIVFSFVFLFLILFIYSKKRLINSTNFFFLLWTGLFLWLGLGYLAFPLARVPFVSTLWRSLDVFRFWVYLAIPLSILGAAMLNFLITKRKRPYKILIVTFLLLMIIGAFIKSSYSLTQPINPQLPYNVSNSKIPDELINYFKTKQEYGRVLAIKCPLWIYLLPYYIDKPLIDGWYPQEKLIPILLNISDYRINDLETTENRSEVWRTKLIQNHRSLGINWVMISDENQSLINELMDSSGFKKDIEIDYEQWKIYIFEAEDRIEMAELVPSRTTQVEFLRQAPDHIRINLFPSPRNGTLIVKEAYYRTWIAGSDGLQFNIERTGKNEAELLGIEEGFIMIPFQNEIDSIELYQRAESNNYPLISIFSLIILTLIIIIPHKKFWTNEIMG